MVKAGPRMERVGKNGWVFIWPEDAGASKYFDAGVEESEKGNIEEARACFERALSISPWRFDILHDLAFTYRGTSKYGELLHKAVDLALSFFPKKFDFEHDKLEWGFLDNRLFLNTYYSLGLDYLAKLDIDNAVKCFNQILSWNPNDNQGARSVLADIYVKWHEWGKMLELKGLFIDDADPSVMFGSALAFFMLGKKDDANIALKEAIKYHPICAEELLKETHKKPRNISEEYVTVGGADEAYYFWEQQGSASVWHMPKVKEWIENCLK
ncbi:MAG: tetratricopeptide repeat protein [Candidatus Diapherotrites archaeon]|nr:tetratricopeptide repeat protein [Candidatus Diapherotrites archaeon]